MDDSLERDQLNLWEKLNRLYGEGTGENRGDPDATVDDEEPAAAGPEEEREAPAEETHGDLGSAALEEVAPDPGIEAGAGSAEDVNEVCADCRYDCPQPAVGFVISRCKLANDSRPENRQATLNQLATSAGSMGIEKINETCRRCRRSCKQRSAKLNKMLCLGFIPLEDGRSEND